MAQSVTDTSRDDECEFDDWLEKHNLKDVKQIFIEHNMYRLNDLSLQNGNLGSLLADRRFYNKGNLVTSIFAAIQSLTKQRSTPLNIIISPSEDKAMKQLQQYVDEMTQLENESKQLYDNYNNKIISNNNILEEYQTKCSRELTEISTHVINCINQLKELLKQKETSLYQEIGAYHAELKQQKSKRIKDINAIEDAIDDKLNKYVNAIKEGIQYYRTQIVDCKNILQTYSSKENGRFDEYSSSHNVQREKRIIDVAQNSQIHFSKTNEKMNAYVKRIRLLNTNKSHLMSKPLVSHQDEKKNCEDNSLYPWAIHINQPLFEEIKNDINSLISITYKIKYNDNNNTQQPFISTQKLKNQLKSEKVRNHQLGLQLTKLDELNKSDEKLIERLQRKRSVIQKKIRKYQTHFDEKKDVQLEHNKNMRYVPLQGNKRNMDAARKFDIDASRLWQVSFDRTSIKSCRDHKNKINKECIIYPVHTNKRGYNSGVHAWSVRQNFAVGTRTIGITTKRSYSNVKFECCLYGHKASSWKSGEIIHIILNCDKREVLFCKTIGDLTTEKYYSIKQQKLSSRKSYYFVLVANAFQSTGYQEYKSEPTARYINIYYNKRIKTLEKRRNSINDKKKANKKRKSKINHFLSRNSYLSDGDAEEMKQEYAQINDNSSLSSFAVASLSPKSVKSDGSVKAMDNGNRRSLKRNKSSKRRKSIGAKEAKRFAKRSNKSKYKPSYAAF